MLSLKMLLRVSKWVGKAIFLLFFVLLAVIAVFHHPFVLRKITHQLSNYLSAKIQSRVELGRIDFSIFGNAEVEDLDVWDVNNNKIISVMKIAVKANVFDLITGDLHFDEIKVSGANCKLIHSKEGLNIKFIVDAFKPREKGPPVKLTLQSNKLVLENILVEYTSSVNGINFTVNAGAFTSEENLVSLNPNKIKAAKVYLYRNSVDVLYARPVTRHNSSNSKFVNFLTPDFGSGIDFEIKNIEVHDNVFTYHVNERKNTQKFDPLHLDLKKINLNLSGILIHEDTLATAVQSLSLEQSVFSLSASANIHLNRHQLVLSAFHVASGTSELNANVDGQYDLVSAVNDNHTSLKIAAWSRINAKELSYWASDSLMNYVKPLETLTSELKGTFTVRKSSIEALHLTTQRSGIHLAGSLHDGLDFEKLCWEDLKVDASLGSDVEHALRPLILGTRFPDNLRLKFSTSGCPTSMLIDGTVSSGAGDVRAKGFVSRLQGEIALQMNFGSEKLDLKQLTDSIGLGFISMSMEAKGIIGNEPDVEIKGLINSIEIFDLPVQNIAFETGIKKSNAIARISVKDEKYRSKITSEISFEGPLVFTTEVQLANFSLGDMLRIDSTLVISGHLNSSVKIDDFSVEGLVRSKGLLVQNSSIHYLLDSIVVNAMVSPNGSYFDCFSNDVIGRMSANFDIRELPAVIGTMYGNTLNDSSQVYSSEGRDLKFEAQLKNSEPFRLFGIDVDFSAIDFAGKFNEELSGGSLRLASEKFRGYGISLDTLSVNLSLLKDSISSNVNIGKLSFQSVDFGDMDFNIHTEGDTALMDFRLSDDSILKLHLGAGILHADSGIFVYPHQLMAFRNEYVVDQSNPVYINGRNVLLDHFLIKQGNMQMNIDGNMTAFDLDLANADITMLSPLFRDSSMINGGRLNGSSSFRNGKLIDLHANIDSLSLYNSSPLTFRVKAASDESKIPFEILLNNESNKINFNGNYDIDNDEIDASVLVDVNDLDMFTPWFPGVVDKMSGSVMVNGKVEGPIKNLALNGSLVLSNAAFTTSSPKFTFNVVHDTIAFNNSSFLLKDFTVYDSENNPLALNGHVTLTENQSLDYDVALSTGKFALMNDRDSTNGRIAGLLVIGTDLKVTGRDNDANIKGSVTIRDTTNVTIQSLTNDVALLSSEGVIDFIDSSFLPVVSADNRASLYDTLMAGLSNFNLNSSLTIEEDAVIRIYMDSQSGDFIQAAGGATLELGYDRTGNVRLSGTYVIKKGRYRVSFYDLVKKDFDLIPGSSINWSGSPENGTLDIKAVYTVRTSSIGLIGNEIGENEKSIYKRALPYNVGINVSGTTERPVISFSLDLPEHEKLNYPVLASKLDRLKLPEFQSELNKQVFGVLVLGGFLPETMSTDVNENLIATTAISNSVNRLLSGQLNQLTSQYIKGMDIEVGIQSYGDYAASGSKTATVMDLRVSKRIMEDRLTFEIGGDFSLDQDQSGSKTSNKKFRGDVAIIYDLTDQGNKKIKLFNNQTYDIIYQEIRNTGVSLLFIREFDRKRKAKHNNR